MKERNMFIRRFASVLFMLLFLMTAGSTANAALLIYNFDVEMDYAAGSNPFGLSVGDTVNAAITLDADNPDDFNSNISFYNPISGLVSLALTVGSSVFIESDDAQYKDNTGNLTGYPSVTINNNDKTINTIEFLCYGGSWTYSVSITNTADDMKFSASALNATWSISGDIPWDTIAPVPVPGTVFIFGAGLFGLAGINRRKQKI